MSQTADAEGSTTGNSSKKGGLRPILIGLIGALALGGGGFYAVYAGLIFAPESGSAPQALSPKELPTFLAIEQLTLSLASPEAAQHLRLSAHIEIAPGRLAEAEAFRPRFLSVMNTYLRAIEPRDLQDPAALFRLRAQLLRRLQMVAGEDLINDFLITEFILN